MTTKDISKAIRNVARLAKVLNLGNVQKKARRSRLNPWRRQQRNKDILTMGLVTMGILALAGNTLYALHHFNVIDLNDVGRRAKRLARKTEHDARQFVDSKIETMNPTTENGRVEFGALKNT